MTAVPSRLLAKIARQDGLWSGLPPEPNWDRFEMGTSDTLLVRAHVGGITTAAILDSGSAVSIISRSLAARLGLSGGEQRAVRGLTGQASATIARGLDVEIGRRTYHIALAYIVDLDSASAALGRPIDLVLGQDVLAGQCLALDFENGRCALIKGFAGGPDWAFTPMGHGEHRELLIYASIAGLEPAPMMLDLGSGTALILSRDYADRNRLIEGKHHSTALLGGLEGKSVATTFVIDRASLAGLEVDSIPTLAVDRWLSSSTVGNIGLPLLAQFDMVLDFTVGRLWLHAPASGRRPAMLKDHSGLSFVASAQVLTVVHVATGSPAERNGWVVGDRVVAIDGRPADSSYTRGSLWRWRFGTAGKRVKLTLDSGVVREIVLADYY